MQEALDDGDPELPVFEIDAVRERMAQRGDPFAAVLSERQVLAAQADRA